MLLSCTEVPVPNEAKRMPPAPPSTHMLVPSVLTAPRGFDPVATSLSAVVVSTTPVLSTRAITRFTVDAEEPVMLAVPTAASYPAAVRYLPSTDRASSPSDVAVPLPVSRLLTPLIEVGSGIDWINIPLGVYSSKKTGVALLERGVPPSPTR